MHQNMYWGLYILFLCEHAENCQEVAKQVILTYYLHRTCLLEVFHQSDTEEQAFFVVTQHSSLAGNPCVATTETVRCLVWVFCCCFGFGFKK